MPLLNPYKKYAPSAAGGGGPSPSWTPAELANEANFWFSAYDLSTLWSDDAKTINAAADNDGLWHWDDQTSNAEELDSILGTVSSKYRTDGSYRWISLTAGYYLALVAWADRGTDHNLYIRMRFTGSDKDGAPFGRSTRYTGRFLDPSGTGLGTNSGLAGGAYAELVDGTAISPADRQGVYNALCADGAWHTFEAQNMVLTNTSFASGTFPCLNLEHGMDIAEIVMTAGNESGPERTNILAYMAEMAP